MWVEEGRVTKLKLLKFRAGRKCCSATDMKAGDGAVPLAVKYNLQNVP